ncbi:phage holin family protein [Streptomyces sp. TRM66268-LWL]|uniref:Phage holin family protein n=1 Tax=Streptomyces polyasparticus TaxID=2767826 RepID=A0ABR7SGC7_9ACTN|nr:phage holin family protein [Streptomyces polyasparticus]MBC9713368.1 phage holin family protein [Streptomyces polyasparticus]
MERTGPITTENPAEKAMSDTLAQVVRDTVRAEIRDELRTELREELRKQTRKQRRTASLYAASGAVALYAGAACALALGLVFAIGLPDWAAALIMGVLLAGAAYALRNAARPHPARPPHQGEMPDQTHAYEGMAPHPPPSPPGGAAQTPEATAAPGVPPVSPPGGPPGTPAPPVEPPREPRLGPADSRYPEGR